VNFYDKGCLDSTVHKEKFPGTWKGDFEKFKKEYLPFFINLFNEYSKSKYTIELLKQYTSKEVYILTKLRELWDKYEK